MFLRTVREKTAAVEGDKLLDILKSGPNVFTFGRSGDVFLIS